MPKSKSFTIEVEREADGRWIAEIPVPPGVLWRNAHRDHHACTRLRCAIALDEARRLT